MYLLNADGSIVFLRGCVFTEHSQRTELSHCVTESRLPDVVIWLHMTPSCRSLARLPIHIVMVLHLQMKHRLLFLEALEHILNIDPERAKPKEGISLI